MFRVLTRENSQTASSTVGSQKKTTSDLGNSQSTMELSFISEDSSDAGSNCGEDGNISTSCTMVLTDSDADSLEDLDRQDSMGSVTPSSSSSRKGGLRRSTSTTAYTNNTNLRVSFSDVTVRTHGMCVGDNPAVSLGVPVSLDWNIISQQTIAVDDYEKNSAHPTGQTESELAIPSKERELMVRRAGFTTEDIRSSVRMVNTIKIEREKTIDTLQNASQEEFVERLKRGVWNATFSRKNKQKERDMLQKLRARDAKRVALVAPAC